MSITSLAFVVFVFLTLAVYYLTPNKFRWIVLLISSTAFYLFCSEWCFVFVLFTSLSIYAASLFMQRVSDGQRKYFKENKETLTKEDKKAIKQKNKTKRRFIMLAALLSNIAVLCVFKYSHFAVDSLNMLFSKIGITTLDNSFSLIVPLGISFYTFQSLGYLLDVYWEKYTAETNYFKTLLFVSFFPQMTQGPISDFKQLSNEFFKEHTFTYKKYSYGFQRVIFGFFKKMVLADMIAPYVQDVFKNYPSYAGVTVLLGAFAYSVQIYADFSGYMDIMCGLCEMFDIKLTENFDRPYFSKSIAEYWRRWHISLGTWFKQYIYYPVAMTNWSRKLAFKSKEKLGKHFGETLPATIALIIVWSATGLWHGASWAYIAWGLVNGLFIILSLWLEPLYIKTKTSLHINEEKWLWRAFQVIRTFILVTFIKVLPEVGTLSDGFGLIKRMFTNHSIPTSFNSLLPFVDDKLNFLIIVFSICLLFVTSLIQRKMPIRDYFNRLPIVIRYICLIAAIVIIIIFGVSADGMGGFMYAQF